MNKKDIKLIMVLLAVTLGGFFLFWVIGRQHHGEIGVVEYHDDILFEFNLNDDHIYEFSGSYGKMHLEVKDGSFRVIEVECPNHNCEQMGWHDANSLSPIVCMPNEVMIYTKNK